MKIKAALFYILILFRSSDLLAQPSLKYHADIDGSQMVPVNPIPRTAFGDFTLESNLLFSGGIVVPFYTGGKSASLFRSDSASALGTPLYDFTKGLSVAPNPPFSGGWDEFDFARTLTQSEAVDLQAGRWYVVVDTVENGQYRGRIELVPEPSAWALIALIGAFLAVKGLASRQGFLKDVLKKTYRLHS